MRCRKYNPREARLITGATPSQLEYWIRSGAVVVENPFVGTGCDRSYRFDDLFDVVVCRRLKPLFSIRVLRSIMEDVRHCRLVDLLSDPVSRQGCSALSISLNEELDSWSLAIAERFEIKQQLLGCQSACVVGLNIGLLYEELERAVQTYAQPKEN